MFKIFIHSSSLSRNIFRMDKGILMVCQNGKGPSWKGTKPSGTMSSWAWGAIVFVSNHCCPLPSKGQMLDSGRGIQLRPLGYGALNCKHRIASAPPLAYWGIKIQGSVTLQNLGSSPNLPAQLGKHQLLPRWDQVPGSNPWDWPGFISYVVGWNRFLWSSACKGSTLDKLSLTS